MTVDAHLCIEGAIMLWVLLAVIVLLWSLGLSYHIAGVYIHLLLIVAWGIAYFNLLSGRRQTP